MAKRKFSSHEELHEFEKKKKHKQHGSPSEYKKIPDRPKLRFDEDRNKTMSSSPASIYSTSMAQCCDVYKGKAVKSENKLSHSESSEMKYGRKKKPGSCMKHKHKDKVQETRKRKKCKKNKKAYDCDQDNNNLMQTKTELPKSTTDVSSNWNNLQQILNRHNPRKTVHKKHIQRKHSTTEHVEEKNNKGKEEAAPPDIWFDDVDEVLVDSSRNKELLESTDSARQWDTTKNPLVKPESYKGLTKHVAMDCEMVGVGEDGKDSVLARVSIVNQYGQCIYDKYVTPSEPVTDYRTQYSGIRPEDLENADDFALVQHEVDKMLTGRVLVGHAINNDLKVLFLDHPRKKIRDTSRYRPFRTLTHGATPSLKKLSQLVLGVRVQHEEHNSIQDAQAAMRLYTMYRQKWESEINKRRKFKKNSKT